MSHKIKWIAKGKKYEKPISPGSRPHKDDNIDIPESDEDGIMMPDGKNIYGEPVDARLAVFYIKKLWKEVFNKKLLTIAEDTNALLNFLKEKVENDFKSFDKVDFLNKLDVISSSTEEANNWLAGLLDNSFGITMDKSILLKTLSQPGCEGVRFYLAMKDKADKQHDQDSVEVPYSLPGVLTLVTVGVDCEGTDLHFSYDEKSALPDDIPKIETCSLCTEYPKTPKIVGKHGLRQNGLKPYVLYQYSMLEKRKKGDKPKEAK